MLRRVTILAALLLLPFAVQGQEVAEVSVKEILTPHPDTLQIAIDNQATLTQAQLERLLASPYTGKQVRFTAVILSDLYDSGLASINSVSGVPGRVHIFLRDVEAAQDGTVMPGYTIQVVDGSWQTNGWQNYLPGNVVTVTGSVSASSGSLQLSPTTVTLEADSYEELDLPASIMEPITVSLADVHEAGDADPNFPQAQSRLNLENWSLYVDEYVKFENLTIANSNEWQAGRFNILFLDPTTQRALQFQDISLRYRNDRVGTAYETAGFNVREADDPFVVPAIGSSVNIAGFLNYSRFDSDFNYFTPDQNLRIVPMTDSDLEVLPGGPPTAANVSAPSGLVTGTSDVTITADVTPGEGRTLTAVELLAGAPGAAKTSYPMTLTSGTQYSATIPASALTDGAFVEYVVKATDNAGATTESVPLTFRVLTQINSISDIQQTATGGAGRSPLTGLVVEAASGLMDLEVTLQTDADSTNLFVVQDASAPWSGMFLAPSNDLRALSAGTIIRITGGTVAENFDVTQLNNVTFEVVGPGTVLPPVEVTTAELSTPGVAESYEGVFVRFSNVEITNVNADGPSQNHGEFLIQTVGATAAVRVDDQSAAIPTRYNDSLAVGTQFSYVQGIWYYSFSNYKLLPLVLSDLAFATSNEGVELPVGFGLGQSYPNPARAAVAVPFSLETAGFVTLDVFDTLGRRVARIAAEDRPAGQQEVAFDTRGLGAGLYLIRLSAGGQTETRSLVVVR